MSAAERARELLAGITPGKWEAEPWEGTARESVNVLAGSLWGPRVAGLVGRNSDAEFIAAAPDLVRDLLAELDQARAGRDMWGRTANALGGNMEDVGHILSGVRYDEAEDVYRAANRVVAERDAALATLAEVREVVHRVGDFAIKDVDGIVAIAAILDRGPR